MMNKRALCSNVFVFIGGLVHVFKNDFIVAGRRYWICITPHTFV